MAGIAEHLATEHVGGNAGSFFLGLGDDDAFSGGQTIRLDDYGRVEVAESGFHFLRRCADRVVGSRNAMPLHEFFGETLAGLELVGGAGGSEDGPLAAA